MSNFNLPPGVSSWMIPGDRPEDIEWEREAESSLIHPQDCCLYHVVVHWHEGYDPETGPYEQMVYICDRCGKQWDSEDWQALDELVCRYCAVSRSELADRIYELDGVQLDPEATSRIELMTHLDAAEAREARYGEEGVA